jgi:Transposase, Mutator family
MPRRIGYAMRNVTSAARHAARAGHYERKLQTKAGQVKLRIPKLRTQTFEMAIIERYRRRESSVEEALIEMYLAGVSVRRVEDITEALWGTRLERLPQDLKERGLRGVQLIISDACMGLSESAAEFFPDAPVIVRFEMAITPAEFRHLTYVLPGAHQVQLEEMSATCEQTDGQRWQITLSNARTRCLASLSLPIADVEIEMTVTARRRFNISWSNSTLFSAGVEDNRP